MGGISKSTCFSPLNLWTLCRKGGSLEPCSSVRLVQSMVANGHFVPWKY